jgi:hypothetical protein
MRPPITTFADLVTARADLAYAKRKEREATLERRAVERQMDTANKALWEAYLASRGLQVGDLVIATAEIDILGNRKPSGEVYTWGPYYVARVHDMGFTFTYPKGDGTMGKRQPSTWDTPPAFAMLARFVPE